MTDIAAEAMDAAATPPPADNHWRIDRNVPIGVVLLVTCNIAAGIWFAAKLDDRVGKVETWTHENAGTEHRLTAIETKIDLLLDRRTTASVAKPLTSDGGH